MRYLSILFLVACGNEYQISDRSAVPDEALETEISTEPSTIVADEEEVEPQPEVDADDEFEPSPGCGFWVQNGMVAGDTFVLSHPTFTLLSPDVDFLKPGDPLVLTFEVNADPCGDIEFAVQRYALNDEVNFDLWLMEERGEPASVVDDVGTTFDPAAANGVIPSLELHFAWTDDAADVGFDNTGYMGTVAIPAGQAVVITYQFDHTELAPVGTIVDVMLSGLIWRDIGTGQEIEGFNDGHEDMWSTVEFIN